MSTNAPPSGTEITSADAPKAQNGAVKRKGAGLDPMFPWREVVYCDDDLHAAIQLASSVERERVAIILRRWLRRSAISEGYLKFPKPAGG